METLGMTIQPFTMKDFVDILGVWLGMAVSLAPRVAKSDSIRAATIEAWPMARRERRCLIEKE
jgi:hypothetical protein